MNSIAYPIIVLRENAIIYGFKKSKEFLITTVEGLNRNAYDSGIIIDSSGNKFKLLGATRIGWGNTFFGFTLIRKGRLIKIEPKLKELGGISFFEMKNIIIDQLKKNKHYWKPYGGVEMMIGMVESSENKTELVNIFAK